MSDRFFRRSLLLLAFCAVLLVVLGRYTTIDLALADRTFDSAVRDFPLRQTWFASVLMHQWVKWLLIGIGLLFSLSFVKTFLPKEKARARGQDPIRQRRLGIVVLSFMLVPLTVSVLKSLSSQHCPWDLERYGGYAPYVRIFESLPAGVHAGQCFPAGHASSGLWLISLAVFWLPHLPRKAFAVFLLALVPGLALGWVQQLRGAHFLSHTLWSAWIAVLLVLVLTRLLLPVKEAG
jgi:membrane-associated PAP2 superfamily phosphatase